MPPSRTNMLNIITDQQRYDTVGCNGSRVCRTPALDDLACEGVRFTHAFTNTAICTAERATLLTGLEPHKHGMLANTERNIGYPYELPEHLIPFTRYLTTAGYRCGLVGKWHLGRDNGPEHYGIEGTHFPGWGPSTTHPEYEAYLEEHRLPRWSVRDQLSGTFPNGKPSISLAGIYAGPVEGTYPYFLAERAIARLNEYARNYERGGEPFHLSLHFFGPHLPYFSPREYADLYDPGLVERAPSMAETFERKPSVQAAYSGHWAFDTYPWEVWQKITAMYWGYVTLIDAQIGRVLDVVDDLGLRESTAVFFSTDHAGFVGNHRLSDKGPMMYDDIYHIPMLARFPGRWAAGQVVDSFVTLMDLAPTFLDLGELVVPDYMDGRSLRPLLEGATPADWPEEVYMEFHGHHFPYPQRGIRTRTHKLVINPPDVNELYDLVADPHELVNRYDDPAYASIQADLTKRLYAHLVEKEDNFYHWMTTNYEVE